MNDFKKLGFKSDNVLVNGKGIKVLFPENIGNRRDYAVELPSGFSYLDITKEDALRIVKKYS